ncbi:hypothetical protein BC831DRAFT_509850 [Entophlyctis helioformis]|nr:hypothetical protein BC831DRAFT_509850 [Entophlyctis helioformis]
MPSTTEQLPSGTAPDGRPRPPPPPLATSTSTTTTTTTTTTAHSHPHGLAHTHSLAQGGSGSHGPSTPLDMGRSFISYPFSDDDEAAGDDDEDDDDDERDAHAHAHSYGHGHGHGGPSTATATAAPSTTATPSTAATTAATTATTTTTAAATAAATRETSLLSGYLLKKGEQRRTWKKRWFVLRPTLVAYYKNDREYEILNIIDLALVTTVAPVELKKRPFVFGLVTRKRTFYMAAPSLFDMHLWIRSIRAVHRDVHANDPRPVLSPLASVAAGLGGPLGGPVSPGGARVSFALPVLTTTAPTASESGSLPSPTRMTSSYFAHDHNHAHDHDHDHDHQQDAGSVKESIATTESVLTVGSNPSMLAGTSHSALHISDEPSAPAESLMAQIAHALPAGALQQQQQQQQQHQSQQPDPQTLEQLQAHHQRPPATPSLVSMSTDLSFSSGRPSESYSIEVGASRSVQAPAAARPHPASNVHQPSPLARQDTNPAHAQLAHGVSFNAPSSGQSSGRPSRVTFQETPLVNVATPSGDHLDEVVAATHGQLKRLSVTTRDASGAIVRPGIMRASSSPTRESPVSPSGASPDGHDDHPFSDSDEEEYGTNAFKAYQQASASASASAPAPAPAGPYDHLTPGQRQKLHTAIESLVNDQVMIQGYLEKLRGGLQKTWKRRWFVLRNGNLTCYKNDSEYEVSSILPMAKVLDVITIDPPAGKKGSTSSHTGSSAGSVGPPLSPAGGPGASAAVAPFTLGGGAASGVSAASATNASPPALSASLSAAAPAGSSSVSNGGAAVGGHAKESSHGHPHPHPHHVHCFKIVLPKRSWVLCAESAEDVDAWVSTLLSVHHHLHGDYGIHGVYEPAPLSDAAPLTGAAHLASPAGLGSVPMPSY